MSPETCRAELKRLISEKVVASCWLFTSVNCIRLSEEAVRLEAVVNTIVDVEAAWNREIALPVNNCSVVRKLQRHSAGTLIVIHT